MYTVGHIIGMEWSIQCWESYEKLKPLQFQRDADACLLGAYRRITADYAEIALPLTNLVKKSASNKVPGCLC